MAGVTIEGVVEHGRRLGRELGFPTANMAVPDSVTAADGVYYSRAEVDGTLYDAMSFGRRSRPPSGNPYLRVRRFALRPYAACGTGA